MDIEKIIEDLGANYKDSDQQVLKEILEEVSSVASDISNRSSDDKKLIPYIKKAVKAIYLCRGAEGLQSTSESGTSSTFEDTIDKMRNNIVKNGVRRRK